jgi:hypothetical protein
VSQAPGTPVRGPIQRPCVYEDDSDVSSISYSSHPGTPVRGPIQRPDLGISEASDAFGETGDEESDEEIDENFVRDHLSKMPVSHPTWWDNKCSDLVATIQRTGHVDETETYPALCELLNRISEGIYGKPFCSFREPVH